MNDSVVVPPRVSGRELVAVAVWVGSFFGHTITWRGKRFLLRDKRLVPL